MQSQMISLRLDRDLRERFRNALEHLRPTLGAGANTTNVMTLMVSAFVEAVESGKKLRLPLRCATDDGDTVYPTTQLPASVDVIARAAESGVPYKTRRCRQKTATKAS